MSGQDFQPLEISANLGPATGEVKAYAGAVVGAAGAANQLATAQDNLAGKNRLVEQSSQKNEILMRQQRLAMLTMVDAVEKNTIAVTAGGKAASGSRGAHDELHQTFGKGKHEMREYLQIGEHLTGMHTGLSGVIRLAMNPAFLALGATALIVGKAFEAYKKHQEAIDEATKKSVEDVLHYVEGLEKLDSAIRQLATGQLAMIAHAKKYKEIELNKHIKLDAEALEKANEELDRAKGKLGRHIAQMGYLGGEVDMNTELSRHYSGVVEEASNKVDLLTDALKKDQFILDHHGLSMERNDELQAKMNKVTEQAYGIHHKTADAEKWHSEQVALLSEMFVHGITVAGGYAAKVKEIESIFDDMKKKATSKGDAKIVNERQAFFQELEKLEAKSQKTALDREIAALNAEFKAKEDQAKKILKGKKDLNDALLRLQNAYVGQLNVILNKEAADERKRDADQVKRAQAWQKEYTTWFKKNEDEKRKYHQKTTDMLSLIDKKGFKLRLQQLKNEKADELAANQAWYGEDINRYEEYMARKHAIDEKYKAATIQITADEMAAKKASYASAASAAVSAMSGVFGKNKAFAVIQALMNMYQGITAVWAQWGAYPPVAAALTVVVAASSAMEINKIKSAQDPAAGSGQAHSGMVYPVGRNASYLVNMQAGEAHATFPNTSGLMSFSAALTRLAQGAGRGGGKGGDTFHFNAPVYSRAQHAQDLARTTARVSRRRRVVGVARA